MAGRRGEVGTIRDGRTATAVEGRAARIVIVFRLRVFMSWVYCCHQTLVSACGFTRGIGMPRGLVVGARFIISSAY